MWPKTPRAGSRCCANTATCPPAQPPERRIPVKHSTGQHQARLSHVLAGVSFTLSKISSVLVDGGYTGETFAQGVQEILGKDVTVQVAKRSELHKFAVIPKRWVVERSFAWLEKNRRLWKNCERDLNTSLQFVHLAFLALLLRRS